MNNQINSLSDYERKIIYDALNELDRQYCMGNFVAEDPDRFIAVLRMLMIRFDSRYSEWYSPDDFVFD
ncbi:MAG TPA: hypothetical protein VH500_16250 [Nitrososphaeraceae archaeon]|jgi:hypothetical protein